MKQTKKIPSGEYHIYGQGKPVLLVHGFAEDHRVWEQQVAALQQQYQLIVPDLPGSGQSSPGNPAEWTMEYFADYLKKILDAEQISSCAMVGHSMGGYITLAFAQKYPDLLNGWGLFHSSAFADDAAKIATRRRGIDFINTHGTVKFLQQSIPNLFSDSWKKAHSSIIDTLTEQYAYFTPASLEGYYEAMIRRPDSTDALRETSHPVLFIIGKEDKSVPFEQSMQQCHLPRLSYVHVLHHSAHMGMLEETAFSNQYLAEFLDNL